jgi:glycosyltransferase involved in cell wall biosynthesis
MPEMRLQLHDSRWDDIIARTEACAAACRRRVVATPLAVPFYEHCGPVDVLPIGVDTDLFKPATPDRRAELRRIHQMPEDRRVGFWMGTNHAMKGFDRLQQYAAENPDIFWIIVSKSRRERCLLHGASNWTHVPQEFLAELMQCADFLLCPGRLRPFFMVEWEAMSAGLPVVNISGLDKDFEPGANPRDQVFELGWDRASAKVKWLEYINA